MRVPQPPPSSATLDPRQQQVEGNVQAVGHMSGAIHVARPIDEVFQAVLDEPTWNPAMGQLTPLTPGAHGVGTRYAVVMRMGRGMPMEVEFTEFERPTRLGTRTRSSLMSTQGTVTLSQEGDGTRVAWDWQYQLHGPMRAASPVFVLLGGRWERRNWQRMRDWAEGGAAPTA